MNKDFIFTDYLTLTPTEVDSQKRSLVETKDEDSSTGYSLDVLVNVTFAGIFTKNNGFYLPDRVFKGVPTWTSPFEKPVLVHHDDFKDPIGRVAAGRYIDTVGELKSQYPDLKYILDSSNTSKMLKAVQNFRSFATQDNYQGLGHIRVHKKITDTEAIKKILDGRYLTVSSSFSSPDGALCGVCGVNFKDEMCEHIPGHPAEELDGENAFFIPLSFIYSESSYVNKPAIEMAQNFSIGAGFDDKMVVNEKSKIFSVIADMYIRNNRYLSSVTGKDSINLLSHTTEVKDLETLLKACNCNKETKPKVTECDKKGSGEDMNKKYKETTIDTETNYALVAEFLDKTKVLTKEQLTALKDSDFLGPNRTYPVLDKEHVDACRKTLESLEDKDSKAVKLVLTWLDKRVEKLETKSEKKEEKAEPTIEDQLKTANDELVALKDETELYKTRVKSLETELETSLQDNVALAKDYKQLLADMLLALQVQAGRKVEDTEKVLKEYLERSNESLKDSIKDTQDLVVKRQDAAPGSSKVPDGTKVPDPTTDTTDAKADLGKAKERYALLISQYKDTKTFKGPVAAKRLEYGFKAQGLVPQDLDFDTLVS